jgi:hypothetical protein
MSSQTSGPSPDAIPATQVTLPIHEPGVRLFLLTRLILTFDSGDERVIAQLLAAGFTAELVDKLRSMSLIDALRFVASHCGLSVAVDADAVKLQMVKLERSRADRQLYEYFVHAGASPTTISRLFGVAAADVRRLRKLVAPQVATGGRPRCPPEALRLDIEAAWQRISSQESSERQALWKLHQQFPTETIAALESVIRPAAGSSAYRSPGSPSAAGLANGAWPASPFSLASHTALSAA